MNNSKENILDMERSGISFCDLRVYFKKETISHWKKNYSDVSNSSLQKYYSGESTVLNLKSILFVQQIL